MGLRKLTLANKYRPKSFSDVVEQELVTNILENICKSELSNRNFLLIGPAGTGKAQPLYSKVLTPSGFIEMRNVVPGTVVINAEGKPCNVLGVYPQGKRKIYEITTQGNNKIRVSDNHLNSVWVYNQAKKCREDYVLTTVDLIDFLSKSIYKVRLDIPIVDWEKQAVPIDPYLLGIIISEGSMAKGNFFITNPESDIIDKINKKLGEIGYELHGGPLMWNICMCQHKVCNQFIGCSELKSKLNSMGLLTKSINKHIPKSYLNNSKEVRVALLQGLFDGDGHIDKRGCVKYSTSSKQLSEDFAFLVRSLGIRDNIVIEESSYKDPNGEKCVCSTKYRHYLKIPNDIKFYTSQKHSNRYIPRQNSPLRNIISIDYIGEEECQCIYVDTPSHTYISDDFIPTHNTTLARIIGNTLNDSECEAIEIDAASNSGVESMRDIVQQAKSYPIGTKYKIIIIDECHALSSQAWQSLLKILEESPARSVFIFCTTNPEKIPNTIISRVQTFQLSKISLNGIYSRLVYVLDDEIKSGRKIVYDEDGVLFIAKLANGGMRDALTLLDKVLVYTSNISSESVTDALNLPSYDDYFSLLSAISKKDNTVISTIIQNVYNSGVNFVKWFEDFHSFIINIVKYIYLQDINKTMIPTHYQEKICKYSTGHSTVCLKLANKLITLNQELKNTNYQQEIALTYLCSVPKSNK